MTHKHSFLTALTVLLIPLLFFANRATAQTITVEQIQQTESVECKALDVVILIDQSDSMRDTNDPNGNRFAAANTIIDYLGNHAVWLCAEQKVQHRVTVAGFGDNPNQPVYEGEELPGNDYKDDVEIYLDNQIIPMQLGDLPPALMFEQNWSPERNQVKEEIEKGTDDKLGATDHYSALLMAQDILNEWKQNPLPGGARTQAIIMITDGETCLLARGCTKTIYNFLPDLTAIETLTDPDGIAFPWRSGDSSDNVYLSLITFSRRSGPFPEAFLRIWREITTSHGGNVYPANQRNTNLNAIVTNIISGIAGSGMEPVSCNTDFWVQPYTDNLIILYAFSLADEVERAIISVESDGETIQILQGQSSSDQLSVTTYIADGRNEYYVFSSPLPGRYRVSLPGVSATGECEAEMEIGYEKSSVTAQVIMPTSNSLYPAVDPPNTFLGEKFQVEVFQATEDVSGQNHLVEVTSGDYPLMITATVANATETFQTSFPLVKVQDGIYESHNLIPSPQPGAYTWEAVATVRNADPLGQPIEVFRITGGFTATEVNVFGFDIIEPSSGVNLALNTVQSNQQIPIRIPVAVEFIGANGQPLNATSVLSETSNLFTASLMGGDVVHETIDLSLQTDSTSLFVGEFANNNAGHILATGDYTIRVEATWELDNFDALYYAPATTVRSVDFTQYEITPLDLIIRTPGNLTLHKNDWRASLYGELQPFDFQVDVVNAISGDVMGLQPVLADPSASIQASLFLPDGSPLLITLEQSSDNQNFLVQNLGEDLSLPGEYGVRVLANQLALQNNFAWAVSEKEAAFTRIDTPQSNPATWRLYAGIYAALTGMLALVTIYFWTGGPKGRIAFTELNHYGKEETVAGPIRLRWMPRRNRLKHKWLKQNNIKYLKVRKTTPLDPDFKRAIHVQAIDKGGMAVYDTILYPAQSETFIEGNILYEE